MKEPEWQDIRARFAEMAEEVGFLKARIELLEKRPQTYVPTVWVYPTYNWPPTINWFNGNANACANPPNVYLNQFYL